MRLNSILLLVERHFSGSVGEVVERDVGANNAARLLTCLAVANSDHCCRTFQLLSPIGSR
jgi:hypothetical protein